MAIKPLNDEVKKAFELLGHNNVDIPADADISGLQKDVDSSGEDLVQKVGVQDEYQGQVKNENNTGYGNAGQYGVTTPESNQQVDGNAEQVQQDQSQEEVTNVDPDQQVSEEEMRRRGFQSETATTLNKLNEVERQNAYLMQTMQAMMSGQSNAVAPIPQEVKEPEVFDFINQDDYDPDETNDQRTKTGRAVSKYNKATREYEKRQWKQEVLGDLSKQKQDQVVEQQAQNLAKNNAEFRNPIDGKPDYEKIKTWMSVLSSSGDPNLWSNIYDMQKSNNGKESKPNQSQSNGQNIEKIAKRANQISSVAQQSASEAVKRPASESVNSAVSIYGDIELPVDSDFE